MTNGPWWESGVIYQIYPRSFMDSNHDGIGDLAGVASRLDYLRWLGVDAIWLSPIYPSPMADFGYDVSDHKAIHPEFGTMEEFECLIRAAESRGIRVVMDLVPNHTSVAHPWFRESCLSRHSPRRDWYVWKDPKPDGGPPTNWISYFGGSSWTYQERTGQYYLHTFLPEQPDLNWRNPDVRAAMYDVMRFWLDRGVAGFRVDVIEYVMKDPMFRDEPANPDYDPSRHIERFKLKNIHSVAHPDVHEVVRKMRAVVDRYNAVLIGEVSYQADIRRTVSYYGEKNDEAHLPFNFGLINLTASREQLDARTLQDYINRYDGAVPSGGWPNYVLGNHDKPRIATRFGPCGRLAAMMLFTLRGTPFIYYGDEIGMKDVPLSAHHQGDPFGGQDSGQSRDPARTPMQWSSEPNAGFSGPEGRPWLPVSPDHLTVNVERQLGMPGSFLMFCRSLLQVRRRTPTLIRGSYREIQVGREGVVAYARQLDDQIRFIVLNFSGGTQRLNLARSGRGRTILSTQMDRREPDMSLRDLQVYPYEGLLLAAGQNPVGLPSSRYKAARMPPST